MLVPLLLSSLLHVTATQQLISAEERDVTEGALSLRFRVNELNQTPMTEEAPHPSQGGVVLQERSLDQQNHHPLDSVRNANPRALPQTH